MQKSRFLIIGQLPPPVHGSNVMAALFMDSLRGLGHEVGIVQKTFSQQQSEVGKISIRKLEMVPVISIRLIRQILLKKPNLCFYFISMGLTSFLVDALFLFMVRRFRVPYILYCHGKGLRELGSSGNLLVRGIAHKTLGGAMGALVLGERLKADLTPYLNGARLYILPNAIQDDVGIQPVPKRQDNKLVRVLFLSNLKPDKGPWEFLLMAKEVAAQAPQVRFILAGPKRSEIFYQKLLDFIGKEGLGDLVELPGGLYGEEKHRAFQDSDIFVFPTSREAFPLVNLEAMRWGLPVISSKEGAIPEMVIDGKTGYIVNPKDISQLTDRVLKLVIDREFRLRMGRAGRQRFEERYTTAVYQENLARALEYFSDLHAPITPKT